MRPPRPVPLLPRLLFLLLLVLPSLHATRFEYHNILAPKGPAPFPLSANLQDVIFGISSSGEFRAQINTTISEKCRNHLSLALCVAASDSVVRAPSFERRHASATTAKLYESLFRVLTNKREPSDSLIEDCVKTQVKNTNDSYFFAVRSSRDQPGRLKAHKLYIALLVFECSEPDDQFFVNVDVEWKNPGTIFPELGWEEAAFPFVAAAALVILSAEFLLLLLSILVATLRALRVPRPLLLALAATAIKALHAALTFLYFWGVAQNGRRERWYFYGRLIIVATGDAVFVCLAMAMSVGYHILPTNWFVDGHSPIFLIYIGVVLQLLIIIAVKLLFPVRFLGVLTYTAAAGVIAVAMCTASYRNCRFLRRFAELIERAHIYVKTTPIPRMQLYFSINVFIVAIVYLFKIISVGVWDYGIRRPDAMWGSLEIADAILLLWYTFSLFPRKKSALYVQLSNISNERLNQADTWRANLTGDGLREAHQARNGQGIENENGRQGSEEIGDVDADSDSESVVRAQSAAEEGRVHSLNRQNPGGPQPPWVEWQSGMSLPRPNTSTWGGYVQVPRVLRKERRLVPVLPSSIVLGSPCDSPDTLKLTLGLPTTGPNSVPKVFDEKGIEVGAISSRSTQGETLLSVRDLAASSVEGRASEPGSERGIRLQGILRGFGVNNRVPHAAASGDSGADNGAVENIGVEPSSTLTRSPSQSGTAHTAEPSVASSNASCDGMLCIEENR